MELVSAPPSLVSRCGVVYLPTDEQDWLNFSTIWLKDLDPRITGAHVQLLENSFARADVVLEGMIETIVGPTLAFIRKECREPVQYVSDVHKIRSLLKMFEVLSLDVIRTLETSASEGGGGKSQSGDAGKGSVMSGGMESQSGGMMMSSSKGGPGGGKKSSKEDGEVVRDFVHSDWVQPLFFFAIVWTVCAAIDNEGVLLEMDVHAEIFFWTCTPWVLAHQGSHIERLRKTDISSLISRRENQGGCLSPGLVFHRKHQPEGREAQWQAHAVRNAACKPAPPLRLHLRLCLL